jgi:inorganic pyrophosphatase
MGTLKQLLPWQGEPLVAYGVRQLLAAGVAEVVVVVGHAADEVGPVAAAAGARVVGNPDYATGRASSVRAGAAALPDDTLAIVTLNVDQPRPAALIRRVLDAHQAGGALITGPESGGRRGHPVVFAGELLPELRAVSEETEGLRAVVHRHADRRRLLAVDGPAIHLEVNTPDEYAAAVRSQEATDRAAMEKRTMTEPSIDPMWRLLGSRFKAHPWHGLSIGKDVPDVVTAFIEIVPTDTVKYEVDKLSGYLKIDRPQQFSNVCPTLYGLIPQTLCADRVGAYSGERTGREDVIGDGDPMDICVLTEKEIMHGDILVQAIPIGGLRMIDRNEADDKIIAVMKGDALYGSWRDIGDCPAPVLDRLKHYFLTYKNNPNSENRPVEIAGVYGRDEAHEVIARSQEDYNARFAGVLARLAESLRG